ncbi:cytochrome b/b6 domain-containing protein [Lysobacter sp. GX 14042]|uniref:cytochrome b n=1 Tax=Lysobacter sp. GX 14042 TaxID=2907155 RepID=UPI001F166BBF|nr:cytochrome b/b6 domain-containing protein [Lysobacter sp. GX 14042]MCE7031209.1 cytochrome b/b6 domain-containing protein [Lysobacter sp. GX 14042]
MLHDSPERYGLVTRLLHWSMAVLVLLQFVKFFERLDGGGGSLVETIAGWHTSVGTLLLVLVLARIAWAFAQRRRRPVNDPALAIFVIAGHVMLYAALLALPVMGLLIMLGGGYGHSAFGIGLFPPGEEVGWARVWGSLHSPLAWLLAVAVAVHIAAALYHHFIRRDRVLRRML